MWAAPAYHRNEGATTHPRAYSIACSMMGGHIVVVWVGTWNLGRPSGKGEVCEELRKRMIDVFCLQEARWRGQVARMVGINGRRYKMGWSGKGDVCLGAMAKE